VGHTLGVVGIRPSGNCPNSYYQKMKENSVLQILVIGCGAVFEELHGEALQKLEKRGLIRVVAMADRVEKQLERFKERFPQAIGYSDARSAFAGRSIDLTLVASPPGLHRAHCEVALQSGSDVLCEKPLTTTAEDATWLANLAAKSKRILAVGQTRRFFPSLAKAAQMVAEGTLGDNLEFTCREGAVSNWPLTSDSLYRRKTAGGGVLADKGVHVLDTLLWIFGEMAIQSSQDDAQSDGVEGNILLELVGPKVKGTVRLSFDQSLNNGFWIQGSKGTLSVQPDEFRFVRFRNGTGAWERLPCSAEWPADAAGEQAVKMVPKTYEECILLQWLVVIRAVKYGEVVPVTAAHAGFVISQIEEAYRIAEPLPQPWLSQQEQSAFVARHWKHAHKADFVAHLA
jgi:predicted dehydrogenase